uniref:3CxxC-type domain-containing protein n=1 Tax=Anolis carolinensis TaxID=28377 RepID=H9GC38_ANOCA|nr:PREDICTED: uncharacterized protein LOC103281310 [Anolis carolinensis]|eukprot:XP_008120851.1 PREDICTED: uncharacterized protein LOC103281310 [Anolis carolinensis]
MEKNNGFWRAVFKEKIRAAKPEDAWSLMMDETLELYQVPSGWKRFLQDHAYARFTCSECGHRWASYKVILLFHVCWQPHKRQGCIRMRCFKQQCHKCMSKHEDPEFTEESASKVLENFIVTIRKECYGEHIEDAELSEVVIHSTGPHQRELCEGCQLGLHKGPRDWPQGGVHQGRVSTWEPEGTHDWPQGGVHQGRVSTWEPEGTHNWPQRGGHQVGRFTWIPDRTHDWPQGGVHQGRVSTWEPERTHDWPQGGVHQGRVSTWEPEGTHNWPQRGGHQVGRFTWIPDRTHDWPQGGVHQGRVSTWEHNYTRFLQPTDAITTPEPSLTAVMNPCSCSKHYIYITIAVVAIAIAVIIMIFVVIYSCGLL